MTPPTAACTRADCPGEGSGRINPRGFRTECGRRPRPADPAAQGPSTPPGQAPGPAAPGTATEPATDTGLGPATGARPGTGPSRAADRFVRAVHAAPGASPEGEAP